MTALTPVLSRQWADERSWTLTTYEAGGGYAALGKALKSAPADVARIVKDSGLRGRGGAGFLTAAKWGYLPPDDGGPRYLVINADESEPGTCKDVPLMMASPHLLVEGIAITAYATGVEHAFIYLRGEVVHVHRRLIQAIEEARAKGYLGKNILGSGFDLEVTVHAGAGAYICGEETALLSSLEGYRGQPRLRPPYPAVSGLYSRPTIVNNVETIASVPGIIGKGAAWFSSMGTKGSKGHVLYSLSGHIQRPGQYEAPFGVTLRELIQMAGGMRPGRRLKFWTPGGSSTALLTVDHLDLPLDHESIEAAGSSLGTRGIQVFDDSTCVVRAVSRWTDFYRRESCGKCTPCREGTFWLSQILERIEAGRGTKADIDQLVETCLSIDGRSFCALGDSATLPIASSIEHFKAEYKVHISGHGCPFDPRETALFPAGAAKEADA
jgi:NADH-quinone oxidoreductase subunit F